MRVIKGFQELVINKLNIKKLVYGAGGNYYRMISVMVVLQRKYLELVVIANNSKDTWSDYGAGDDYHKHIYEAG